MRTLVVVCLTLLALTAAAAPSERTIAVTFDDLPAGSVLHPDAVGMREILQPIVDSCVARRIPVIGFVNENKLYVEGKLVPARRQLLAVWLEAGLELGNHSYSHPDLHHMPTDEYLDDVARGEAVTRSLLALRGEELGWFRHPFLHTGRSFEAKRVVERFLAKRGVAVAPVTVDNDDYLFAAAWDRAAERGDAVTQTRLEAAYVPYMVDKVAYYEAQSRALFGREIPQVLLLHANSINARRFAALADALAERGYRFVPLAEAVADPAYDSLDEYVGPAGISWLHRWALTRGVEKGFFRGEPETPEWVATAARSR